MSVKFLSKASEDNDPVLQGDIFRDVSYIYKTSDNKSFVDITEFEFPYVVVISQSCDVSAMSIMVGEGGKSLKFMPSVLLAPIYDKETLKSGEVFNEIIKSADYHISKEDHFNSKQFETIKNDNHYRFQLLQFKGKNPIDFENPIIDFKHYFTVSVEYLNSIRNNRVCHLDQLFCENITLRFSNYLSRVAFPDYNENQNDTES